MKDELTLLKDGDYLFDINNIIVDEHGKIVYFEYQDMKRYIQKEEPTTDAADTAKHHIIRYSFKPAGATTFTAQGNSLPPQFRNARVTLVRGDTPGTPEELDAATQQKIYSKIAELMDVAPAFEPATTNGKKVICQYESLSFWNTFRVKDHKIYDRNDKNEYAEVK